mmetsp:Transcript_18652/g.43146  ORF Transcript_18652/g.43146 Transcript_18652/m.43146 type:complete len:200 (+) Transcript_18652:1000-1599(+)
MLVRIRRVRKRASRLHGRSSSSSSSSGISSSIALASSSTDMRWSPRRSGILRRTAALRAAEVACIEASFRRPGRTESFFALTPAVSASFDFGRWWSWGGFLGSVKNGIDFAPMPASVFWLKRDDDRRCHRSAGVFGFRWTGNAAVGWTVKPSAFRTLAAAPKTIQASSRKVRHDRPLILRFSDAIVCETLRFREVGVYV